MEKKKKGGGGYNYVFNLKLSCLNCHFFYVSVQKPLYIGNTSVGTPLL